MADPELLRTVAQENGVRVCPWVPTVQLSMVAVKRDPNSPDRWAFYTQRGSFG